jgi:lipopolysaccharide heptosyltransferase III
MKRLTSVLKLDCRHFRGDLPCLPHKQYGVHCVDEQRRNCRYYERIDQRILIIKLGAIGDVIRTTPLLRRLKDEYKKAEIWWLTLTPEVLPGLVDVPMAFTVQNVLILQSVHFDMVLSLDKDREACALATAISADVKKGYILFNGKCTPTNKAAEHKYMTGLFDDISQKNRKSYQQEIFEIAGYKFGGEEYIMPSIPEYRWELPKNRIIFGLNTGCGGRWTSRLWPDEYWIELAKGLRRKQYLPLLLGGEQEHRKNLKIARQSRALYLGHFPMKQFMSLMDRCELIVTAVTMGMHIAIGLQKKLVLFNNIFNKYEFELYGRGKILEPDIACDCYYSPTCPNECMRSLSVDAVFDACEKLLKQSKV